VRASTSLSYARTKIAGVDPPDEVFEGTQTRSLDQGIDATTILRSTRC
jgi:hypothetical protein